MTVIYAVAKNASGLFEHNSGASFRKKVIAHIPTLKFQVIMLTLLGYWKDYLG